MKTPDTMYPERLHRSGKPLFQALPARLSQHTTNRSISRLKANNGGERICRVQSWQPQQRSSHQQDLSKPQPPDSWTPRNQDPTTPAQPGYTLPPPRAKPRSPSPSLPGLPLPAHRPPRRQPTAWTIPQSNQRRKLISMTPTTARPRRRQPQDFNTAHRTPVTPRYPKGCPIEGHDGYGCTCPPLLPVAVRRHSPDARVANPKTIRPAFAGLDTRDPCHSCQTPTNASSTSETN